MRLLLMCLSGHGPACEVDGAMASFEDWAFTGWIEGLAAVPQEEKTLACLSWAASAMQAYKGKGKGMGFGDAIQCAFEDGILTKPSEYVVAMGDTTSM